ncbi:hypothetical protein HHI36_019550 [Cryptolaemus montrouzieri]|uniref:Uncharacterized protein n=1 Tax=Cryptolaemus montrouzieri TaxID=559131 RepID=A0ABD2N858_9CUCU
MATIMKKIVVILVVLVFSVYSEDSKCPKPEELENKESYCYRIHVDILDRVYETSQSLINLAKKKFKMEVIEDEKVPEKCEYYQCILQELHFLNSKKFPMYEIIKTWIEEHVVLSQGVELLNRLNLCNDALSNSTVAELRFRGDLTMEKFSSDTENDVNRKCDMDAEFLRCLSLQNGCPVFKYP